MDSLTETKFGFKDAQFEACQSDCLVARPDFRIRANNGHSVNADGCIVLQLPLNLSHDWASGDRGGCQGGHDLTFDGLMIALISRRSIILKVSDCFEPFSASQ